MRIRGRRDLQAAIEQMSGLTGNERAHRTERLALIGRARQLGAMNLIPARWETSTGRYTSTSSARNARR